VRDAEASVQVAGAEVFDSEGSLSYPTVAFGQATIAGAVQSWFDDSIDLVSEDVALGGRDPDENRELNQAMMVSSTEVAAVVALQATGFDVEVTGTGAAIAEVQPDGPSDGLLAAGDTVVAVDGAPVSRSDEMVDLVSGSAPGTVLTLTVEAFDGDDARPVEVTLGERPDDPTKGLLGVATTTRDLDYVLPVDVSIDSGDVGGPSAGLAYTLSIIEALTPGSITGGRSVVATGTIELDSSVGPVGGIRQKMAVVLATGTEVFLVPAQEYDEAKALADGRVEVVSVSSLDEALEALESLGGDVSEVSQLASGG
jgi:PDZ domain-containing protein